jgi:hypothetical protein
MIDTLNYATDTFYEEQSLSDVVREAPTVSDQTYDITNGGAGQHSQPNTQCEKIKISNKCSRKTTPKCFPLQAAVECAFQTLLCALRSVQCVDSCMPNICTPKEYTQEVYKNHTGMQCWSATQNLILPKLFTCGHLSNVNINHYNIRVRAGLGFGIQW